VTPAELRAACEADEKNEMGSTNWVDKFCLWWSRTLDPLERTRLAGDGKASYWSGTILYTITDDEELMALWARYQLEKEN